MKPRNRPQVQRGTPPGPGTARWALQNARCGRRGTPTARVSWQRPCATRRGRPGGVRGSRRGVSGACVSWPNAAGRRSAPRHNRGQPSAPPPTTNRRCGARARRGSRSAGGRGTGLHRSPRAGGSGRESPGRPSWEAGPAGAREERASDPGRRCPARLGDRDDRCPRTARRSWRTRETPQWRSRNRCFGSMKPQAMFPNYERAVTSRRNPRVSVALNVKARRAQDANPPPSPGRNNAFARTGPARNDVRRVRSVPSAAQSRRFRQLWTALMMYDSARWVAGQHRAMSAAHTMLAFRAMSADTGKGGPRSS